MPDNAPKNLLFDVDGTVLGDIDTLRHGVGLRFLRCLEELAGRDYRFAFITGNDFALQRDRVLEPIIERGLGPRVFCFSDGGSRAFEFSPDSGAFAEIQAYSEPNVIAPDQVQLVRRLFEETIDPFLEQRPWARLPAVLWYKPANDYIEIRVGPLRPSFVNSPELSRFCDRVRDLGQRPDVRHAKIDIVPGKPGALVIHLLGQDIFPDVSGFINLIHHRILSRAEYRGLSRPEMEVRGGEVACQIALKPFNDQADRVAFHALLSARLQEEAPAQFSVLLGGGTTVDIQLRGVDKRKAVRYLMERQGLQGGDMLYWGNEFGEHGNDLAVARMPDEQRPVGIVNVGPPSGLDTGRIYEDGNGPEGTVSYLKFLLLNTR